LAVLPLLSGKLVKGGSARLCRKVEKNFVTNMGNTWGFLFFLAGFEGILEGKVRRAVHAKKTIGARRRP
jgi:hypothetical protein